MSEAKDDALIYAYHAPQDLPGWCAPLLDPQQALPDEVFHIERSYLSNSVVVVVTAIPAVFALIMTVLDLWHGKLVVKEWLALFPIFTLPFVWSVWIARRDRRLSREIAAGRLRMGLFLTPTALLLRMSPDACSMIPRRWISRFDMTVLNPGRAGSPSSYRMLAYYRVDGKESKLSFDCTELEGYLRQHEALLQLLRTWLMTGRAAAPAKPKRPAPLTPDQIRKTRHEAWQEDEKQRLQTLRKIEAARPKPRKIAPIFLANGSLKTNWEAHTPDEHNYFCCLSSTGEVAAWENWRNYAPSEAGGSVSFAAFLDGEYQDLLRNEFGMAGLEEIIAAVEYLQAHPAELLKI